MRQERRAEVVLFERPDKDFDGLILYKKHLHEAVSVCEAEKHESKQGEEKVDNGHTIWYSNCKRE
jgi:hypothetical protein